MIMPPFHPCLVVSYLCNDKWVMLWTSLVKLMPLPFLIS